MSANPSQPERRREDRRQLDSRLQVLDTIVDTLSTGLILYHPGGDIFKMNVRAKTLLGIAPDAVLSSLNDLPDYLANLRAVLDNPQDQMRSEVALPNFGDTNDEEITLGFSLITLDPPDSECIRTFTFTDITQVLKDRLAMDRIKDELGQSKKLASIGTMISGVAHELNNPLTGISMSTDLTRRGLEKLQKQLAAGEVAPDRIEMLLNEVEKIKKATDKASVLVGDLLNYSRTSQLELEPILLNNLLEETVKAARSQPQFVKFTIDLKQPDTKWPVMADTVKLEQVFYNLLRNACDATEGTGTATVFFEEVVSPQGPMVVVHVKDDGPGIDKTVLNRIFDPFFSTKGDKGVGLGLSISYRTVEQHGGQLAVDSKKDAWTEFTVSLPVYDEENTSE